MRKIVETRSSLSNTIKDTSTIMRNPSLHNSDKGVTHDCASILDSIAKGTSCFHYFSHGASLHRHSFSRMIFTLVYNIQVELFMKKEGELLKEVLSASTTEGNTEVGQDYIIITTPNIVLVASSLHH